METLDETARVGCGLITSGIKPWERADPLRTSRWLVSKLSDRLALYDVYFTDKAHVN
jgi:hypothetical protein